MLFRSSLTRLLAAILALFLLAVLAHITLIRPWYMTWGTTEDERTMPLPGDPFIPPNSVISTRAITIHAPTDEVWPWLRQIGQERGGFYSYSWMENLFGADMHNADAPLPESRWLKVGDTVSYLRDGPPFTRDRVTVLEEGRVVSVGGWSFTLFPLDARTTRLVVRYPYPITDAGGAAYYYLNFEMQHFIMETGMLRGIKQRAEAAYRARGTELSFPNPSLADRK